MKKTIVIFILLIVCWFSYVYYTENNPHYDCEVIAELPIEFTKYSINQICEAAYNDSIGEYEALHITIISDDINSNMRQGHYGKLTFHRGKMYKFGWKHNEHCQIEFDGKIQKFFLGTIYFRGIKQNEIKDISLEEVINLLNKKDRN